MRHGNPFGIEMRDDGEEGFAAFKEWKRTVWPTLLEKPLEEKRLEARDPNLFPVVERLTGVQHRDSDRQQEERNAPSSQAVIRETPEDSTQRRWRRLRNEESDSAPFPFTSHSPNSGLENGGESE